jgi:CDP-glucose 4,6-dehydratase
MSHPLSHFYRGKRVLVTGHTGFQGGWAAAWLKILGAQVYGYGLPPATRPNLFDAMLLDRGMISVFSDVRDRTSLANAFTEFQPEIVLHCASRSNRQFSHREPVETFSTNVMGTVNILEEARLTRSVRALVIMSTPQHSGDLRDGYEKPYIRDASAACAELACSAFEKSFLQDTGTAVATVRSAEAIGGGDWGEGRVVPNLVRSLTLGEPVQVAKESTLAVWHVLDLVHAYLLLGQKLFEGGQEYSGAWDLVPGEKWTAAATDVAKDFVTLWDATEPQPEAGQPSVGNLSLDPPTNDRSRRVLGWSELLPSDRAMRWAVEWYRAFYSEVSSVWRTTEDQIDRFMKSVPIWVEV